MSKEKEQVEKGEFIIEPFLTRHLLHEILEPINPARPVGQLRSTLAVGSTDSFN